MKMKKYLSIAILLMMMASPVVFTSCGNDDPMEEVESPETKLDVWTEPYHIMGANVDEVKSYMAQSMKRYRQVAETSGVNIQLTFMTGQGSEGVLYSFSRLDGSLYSVIDTERSVNRRLVIDYLKKHYTLVYFLFVGAKLRLISHNIIHYICVIIVNICTNANKWRLRPYFRASFKEPVWNTIL